MAYSLDLRQKVVDYIENGGRVTKAAQVFGIGRASIYRWLERKELAATKVKYRQRSLDIRELSKDIQENPEATLKQRAEKFGVSTTAIFKALKKMKITRKKKELRYRERSTKERIKYYQDLRKLIKIYGSKSLVFVDESGFEECPDCIYAWSKKGKKIYGDRQGKRGKRENLVAGRRKGKKDLIAPMIFTGSLNAEGFEGWLSIYLLPSLTITSVLIMDNAPIHRKTVIKQIVEDAGHQVIFLPKYSPDLNDIEHDFSALKRARMYAPSNTPLDEIIRDYCVA